MSETNAGAPPHAVLILMGTAQGLSRILDVAAKLGLGDRVRGQRRGSRDRLSVER